MVKRVVRGWTIWWWSRLTVHGRSTGGLTEQDMSMFGHYRDEEGMEENEDD
jgi:hypothetical protein